MNSKRVEWGDVARIPSPVSNSQAIKVWRVTVRLKCNNRKDRVFYYYYDNHTLKRAKKLAKKQHLPGLLKRYPSYHLGSITGKALTGQALQDYIENEMGQMRLL